MRWCEVTSARVVNRLAAMGSNSSKAYQMQIIAEHGFNVPETLITSDPEAVHEFRRRHRKIVYKSISGVRSIVLDDRLRSVQPGLSAAMADVVVSSVAKRTSPDSGRFRPPR